MGDKFQINADKVMDGEKKIEESIKKMQEAKDILSRLDIPDDFSYGDKLISYKGTFTDIIDSQNSFASWLKTQVENYKGINTNINNLKVYLRETESGFNYLFPISEDQTEIVWSMLPPDIQAQIRMYIGMLKPWIDLITSPVKLGLSIGTLIPGELGEYSASYLKELNFTITMAFESVYDITGADNIKGFEKFIYDTAGKLAGHITIFFVTLRNW